MKKLDPALLELFRTGGATNNKKKWKKVLEKADPSLYNQLFDSSIFTTGVEDESAKGGQQQTLLHFFASQGNMEALRCFLPSKAKGIQLNTKDSKGWAGMYWFHLASSFYSVHCPSHPPSY